MCGIVGFAGFQDKNLIKKLNDSQIHRGPDDEGFYFGDDVTLAMRRLSIVDLQGGHQPQSSFDEKVWIVYNGEIFNAPQLRAELEAQAVKFKTHHSDTEVLIHLYERDGVEMLSRLNGMFGFVIHDQKRKKLFGARDRFGIKPLCYSHEDGKFAFASELKTLKFLPWFNGEIDHQAVSNYLTFQCVPSPQTIYKNLKKIPAAHYFEYDLPSKSLTISRYWYPRFTSQGPQDLAELKPWIRGELTAAVKRWLLSDVPVACSLSGGIDSSTVVGLTAREFPGQKIETYSLGFEDAPEIDETGLARQVSQMWGTKHHEIFIKADDLLQSLEQMIYHLDEPYAGGLPSWYVFKAMSKDFKVAMTGTGGDEIFGNYGKWAAYKNPVRFLKMARHSLRSGAAAMDSLKYPHAFLYPLYFREHAKNDIFTRDFTQSLRPSERLIEDLWGTNLEPQDAIPQIDFQIQLPEEFLHMTDRFSMAHSLEARTPFLDQEFTDKMLSIPASVRTKENGLKYMLIEAVREILPPALLGERKRGFVLPMKKWTQNNLKPQIEDYLGKNYLQSQGIFNPSLYDKFVKPHMAGEKDYTWQIWTLLMFQLWFAKK